MSPLVQENQGEGPINPIGLSNGGLERKVGPGKTHDCSFIDDYLRAQSTCQSGTRAACGVLLLSLRESRWINDEKLQLVWVGRGALSLIDQNRTDRARILHIVTGCNVVLAGNS